MDGMVNYGILQPGIGNALAAGYQQAQDRQNALMQQQQQRQLGDIQLQNALREQRMAGEEEAAWKEGAGKPEQILQALQQRGLGKQAMALQAQMSKQQADKLTMLKTANDLKKQAATAVMANPTLETALGTLQSFAQQTGMDISGDLQALQSTSGDPEKIRAWAAGHAIEADKMLPQLNTKDTGGQVQDRTYNPVTGEIKIIGTTAKTPSPGESARLKFEQDKWNWQKANPDMEIKEGPDGQMIAVNKRTGAAQPVTLGGAAVVGSGKPLTESQAKAANFAGRMNTAFDVIDKLEGSDPSALAKLAAGSGWTNILAPEAAQRYRQAQENWVTANLRKESGAVIGPDEMANEIRKYFPVAGDKPKNIEQKRQARLDAMAGMEAEATESGIKAVQKSRQALGARYQRKPTEGVSPNIEVLLDKYK